MVPSHCLNVTKGEAHLCQLLREGKTLTSRSKRVGKVTQEETRQARHQQDWHCAYVCDLCWGGYEAQER